MTTNDALLLLIANLYSENIELKIQLQEKERNVQILSDESPQE
jgi:hypothetical protein